PSPAPTDYASFKFLTARVSSKSNARFLCSPNTCASPATPSTCISMNFAPKPNNLLPKTCNLRKFDRATRQRVALSSGTRPAVQFGKTKAGGFNRILPLLFLPDVLSAPQHHKNPIVTVPSFQRQSNQR